jgi:hypothetical protein
MVLICGIGDPIAWTSRFVLAGLCVRTAGDALGCSGWALCGAIGDADRSAGFGAGV